MHDMLDITLSEEQKEFIRIACESKNILVDACIGSGKTTAIQMLCDILPSDLDILYLTYNRLLKIDAKKRIRNKNVTVTNYHGFAAKVLSENGIKAAVEELVQVFNEKKLYPGHFDVLIIDEYQDIEQELATMLEYIKEANEGIQIIAVGDMEQKIYDKTRLDVCEFINDFLGEYVKLQFTTCFRLSKEIASKLGRIWGKPIIGVNNDCSVTEMNTERVIEFLSETDPKDILCLGQRKGKMANVLNELEERYPDRFNKRTVFASIADKDACGATEPNENAAIFTTFDSCKGLERPVCVVFDFTESYWNLRVRKPMQSYEILRNIFCVAASRGKQRIIFVENMERMLSEETLSTKRETYNKFGTVDISNMFDFKLKEDVDECFSLIRTKKITEAAENSEIHISNRDGMIDLSPCIGIYQEAAFFGTYNIDTAIDNLLKIRFKKRFDDVNVKELSLNEKILYLVSLDTGQDRYREQVRAPFVSIDERMQLIERLGSELSPDDEEVQVECRIWFADETGKHLVISAAGLADVVKNETVYELKFVSELSHENFLQCACYMVALRLEKGIIWNTRDNSKYEISIPDRKEFLNAVVKTITKGALKNYYPYSKVDYSLSVSRLCFTQKNNIAPALIESNIPKAEKRNTYFAVIDTETNDYDNIISIGIVIADMNGFEPKHCGYYVIYPECNKPAMYSCSLYRSGENMPKIAQYNEAVDEISDILRKYGVADIFAYNASFDKRHLPELAQFNWYEISRIAAYREYNHMITDEYECASTGRLKKWGVETVMRILTKNDSYQENHNAIMDALDELTIMRLSGQEISVYVKAEEASKERRAKHSQADT